MTHPSRCCARSCGTCSRSRAATRRRWSRRGAHTSSCWVSVVRSRTLMWWDAEIALGTGAALQRWGRHGVHSACCTRLDGTRSALHLSPRAAVPIPPCRPLWGGQR